MNYFFEAIAGTLSGLLGAMGLGGGGILIIYLNLFTNIEQSKAQGINLIFFIPIAILAVIIYSQKKLISWKTALIAALFGLIGAFAGSMLSYKIDNHILSKIFGVLLLIMGVSQLFSKNKESST